MVNILFQECTVTHSIIFQSTVFLNHKLQTAKKHSSLLTFVMQGLKKIDVKIISMISEILSCLFYTYPPAPSAWVTICLVLPLAGSK